MIMRETAIVKIHEADRRTIDLEDLDPAQVEELTFDEFNIDLKLRRT